MVGRSAEQSLLLLLPEGSGLVQVRLLIFQNYVLGCQIVRVRGLTRFVWACGSPALESIEGRERFDVELVLGVVERRPCRVPLVSHPASVKTCLELAPSLVSQILRRALGDARREQRAIANVQRGGWHSELTYLWSDVCRIWRARQEPLVPARVVLRLRV